MRKNILKYKCLLPAALLALLSASCSSSDTLESDEDGTPVTVDVRVSTSGATRSLSSNEFTVNSVNILVFNSRNELQYKNSLAAGTKNTKFMLISGNKYRIYAIANATDGFLDNVNTIDDLKALQTAKLASAAALGNADAVLMTGNDSLTVSESTTSQEILMSRLCSKFTFNITPKGGSDIVVTGYRLCNVPLSSYLLDTGSNHLPPVGDAIADKFGSFDAVQTGYTDTTAVSGVNYYVYENLAGNGSATTFTDEKSRNAVNAPAAASYLEVYARGTGWESTYRIYLGEVNKNDGTKDYNDFTDFNIHRNTTCTYDIAVDSSGWGDGRVTVVRHGGNAGSGTSGSNLNGNDTSGNASSGTSGSNLNGSDAGGSAGQGTQGVELSE